MLNNKKKLTTKLSTKVIMIVAEAVCKVWWYGRCKLRRQVNDFDYHITDLRSQYPNELVYSGAVGELPYYCKTNEVDDEYERTSSIKIGDCNIRYTFDKLVKAREIETEEVEYLFGDPREPMITDLITQTKIRHNQPKSLRVLNFERKETNVVKLHNK